jgi:hypothetical protein
VLQQSSVIRSLNMTHAGSYAAAAHPRNRGRQAACPVASVTMNDFPHVPRSTRVAGRGGQPTLRLSRKLVVESDPTEVCEHIADRSSLDHVLRDIASVHQTFETNPRIEIATAVAGPL